MGCTPAGVMVNGNRLLAPLIFKCKQITKSAALSGWHHNGSQSVKQLISLNFSAT